MRGNGLGSWPDMEPAPACEVPADARPAED